MQSRTRAGFTLIEMMVAMALTLFIMVILSQAFILSLEAFSQLKGIGDMQINLRAAENMLRNDLGQDHFEGKRRLSDLTLTGGPQIVARPPQEGFFAVARYSACDLTGTPGFPYVYEGPDVNGMGSFLAFNHVLYMTVKRKGNQQENYFNASLVETSAAPGVLGPFFGPASLTVYNVSPANLATSTLSVPYRGGSYAFYGSQWSEVLYYLVRTGSTEEPSNPTSVQGTPTFSLIRAQFVMVPNGTNVSDLYATPAYTSGQISTLSQTTFQGMSCNPVTSGGVTSLKFFSPADAATQGAPQRVIPDLTRFVPGWVDPPGPGRLINSVFGVRETLVLPNVVSFQVQVMPLGSWAFDDMQPLAPASISAPYLYDTAMTPSSGLKGIRVTLRIWDNKTRQTRQASVVQDL